MRAVDFRNDTFAGLRDALEGQRASAYAAWKIYGPGTTRRVAAEAGIDLLVFRPRSCELLQMGLLSIAGEEVTVAKSGRKKKEGVYCLTEAEAWNDWRQRQVKVNGQQRLL